MALTLNISQDYKVWDRREDVTYVSHATAGDTNYALTAPDGKGAVKRRNLTWKELAASGGVYTSQDRAFLLPVACLPAGLTPKPADRVIDGQGNSWTVLEAPLNSLDSWYKLVSRNLVIAADLRDTCEIQRPVNVQDAAGNRVPNYAAAYSGIPCRLQEIDGDRREAFGKAGFARRYAVFLGQRVVVTTEDRVVVAGVNYQVRSYKDPDRIDVLMQLEVERLP